MSRPSHSIGLGRSLVVGIACLALAESAKSQVTATTTEPFTSLCVAESAVGFDWRNGRWAQTRFHPEKYTLQKLDFERLSKDPDYYKRPTLCAPAELHQVNGNAVVKACYEVRSFGREPFPMRAAMCYEIYEGSKLDYVECSAGNFQPNGAFVKLPSPVSMSVRKDPEKDSMVLSVGTCGVVAR